MTRAIRRLMVTCLGPLVGGCVGDGITSLRARPLPPTALAIIAGSPAASIVAVGGTQQLGATGFTFDGTPVTLDSALYQFNTLSDSIRLKLDRRSGVLTALSSTGVTPVRINVIGFKDGIVRGDQVVVQVTAASLSGLVLSIQPDAPDSSKLASGVTKTIAASVRNPGTGASVATPAVLYKTKGSDSLRVDAYRGQVTYRITSADVMVVRPLTSLTSLAPNQIMALRGEGTAWIHATISAYGTMLTDSVQYTFSYSYAITIATTKANLAIQSQFADQTVTLAPGATVTFQNSVTAPDPLTIAYSFDNPAAATAASPASTIGGSSGNVTALSPGQTSRRRFLTPGTYRWTTSAAGGPAPWPGQSQSGTIVVK